MKTLVQKEMRLLAPAYVLALLLAIVPVWLLSKSNSPGYTPAEAFVPAFWFGAMMLALSAFGREFSLNTFPLILAQPLERHRIWRTKIAVLAGAMASAFAAWCLACTVFMPWMRGDEFGQMLAIGGTAVIVTFAGGLWTTLLLRQAAAAFWFTILVPGAIFIAVGALGGSDALVVAALVVYSILAFFLARRLFFQFQEAGWTGGVVSFPGWRKADAALQPARRAHRPLAALFWKELQLQQVSLVGIGLLFLAHLGVVAVRKYGQDSLGPTLHSGLEVFGGLWLLVPLLVGSSSVAEERKLGAAPNQLCLPLSSRLQYLLKLVFVLVLGGVLSGLLPWIAESIGSAVGSSSNIEAFKTPFDGGTLVLSTLLCLGLSLICFYASTLTRSIVHALAAAAATAAGVLMAWGLASAIAFGYSPIFGVYLWRGYLVFYIALPVLVATFFTMAYRNFRRGSEDWRLWRHNLLSLAGSLLLIATLTTAGYYRAWELVTPLEPQHGPPTLLEPAAASPSGAPPSTSAVASAKAEGGSTLSPNRPLQLCSYGGSALAAVLPDGRLWVDRIWYEPDRPVLAFGEQTGFGVGGKWASVSGSQIEPGSNWVAVAANFRQTVAIRADGTLWVSEKPRREDQFGGGRYYRPPLQEAAPLVRFGQETNWQSVVQCYYESLSVILQKRDGTLWFWSVDHPLAKDPEGLGLRSFEPHRLGTQSDWARILSSRDNSVYAWENDGHAWVIHRPERKTQTGQVIVGDDVVMERSANLDSFKWLSLAPCWPWHAAVREDGTLWGWTNVPPTVSQNGQSFLAQPPVQIGNERDWRSVGGDYGSLAALKTDGSLWRWPRQSDIQREFDLATKAPVRLGTHNDWLGVGNALGGTVSLAADGSLWYWWNRRYDYSENPTQPMLAPSRRPSKIESILDGKEPGHSSH